MKNLPIFGFVLSAIAACTNHESSPLVFGQGITVGISVGQAATGPTPEIVIGVKQADVAVVPTVIPSDVSLDGTENATRRIASHGDGDPGKEDALSTFGSFSSDAKTDQVNLGIFFATGVAAQTLAEGFKCSLSGASDGNCTSD